MRKFPLAALSLLVSLLGFAPTAVFAQGHDTGHGGTDIGLDFDGSFVDALRNLKKADPALYQQLADVNLMATYKAATVVSTTDDLQVVIHGKRQHCVATNDQAALIEVNSARWNSIQNVHVKEALALHEVLSLKKLEDTGKYPISAEYLAIFNLPSDILLTGFSPARALVVAGMLGSTCADVIFYHEGTCRQKLLDKTLFVGEGETTEDARRSALGQCIQNAGRLQSTCQVLFRLDQGEGNQRTYEANITKGCLAIAIRNDDDAELDGILGVGTSADVLMTEQLALAETVSKGTVVFSRCLR